MGKSPHAAVAKDGDTKSPLQQNADIQKSTVTDVKQDLPNIETATADPLGPPPRPAAAASNAVPNTPDYFSVNHNSTITTEQNPFEASFAFGGHNSEGQTPGGTKLPSVASLTSPAGLLGGGVTPGFWGGLRSGPLSPAMLSGPQKHEDYFSERHHIRGGFPTPNESGLRTGLTPGGGGSMFPEPSPNSALFGAIGGATPGAMDFQRAAISIQKNREIPQPRLNITSQPQDLLNGMDTKSTVTGQFDQHDANDAANGLFLLAQQRSAPGTTSHYAMAPQMPVQHAHPQAPNLQMGNQSAEASPQMAHRNHHNGSMSTASGRGNSEMSDENETQSRPNTRGKGKRSNTTQTNGRRKADETPTKAPPAKKSKGNNGNAMPEPESEGELDLTKDEYNANGKKMTDEEKRKNFLERNRVAALKCRQRKKQWLANLQQKVEIFSNENDQLSQQITHLRDEIVNLKTVLMAHKDCPVTQSQGMGGMGVQQLFETGFTGPMNPYGMAQNNMGNPQVMAAGQGMQDRRFS
ncbi:bZIP transcription factor [Glarea lozoyensis ATCC 20868]|uniref:BZIP transcription factor n=1 Tax=Glarea lozoyensis (strain ATCC 20868 / MF5171) TaxID=1116229 RepID=S3CSB0_GLAL2|nr:bZIP transcription factor [Glarea lozoyensis ATCC 20868]EPE28570.1 bZIP transcription factor [Glarea lozoyensis ATCC 20868]